MTKTEKVKTLLKARLQELTKKVGEIDDELRMPVSADSEERATESEDDEVLEDMGNVALEEISQINAALQRIDIGTYGNCTSCGEAIEKKRLDALPDAAYCLNCAEQAKG